MPPEAAWWADGVSYGYRSTLDGSIRGHPPVLSVRCTKVRPTCAYWPMVSTNMSVRMGLSGTLLDFHTGRCVSRISTAGAGAGRGCAVGSCPSISPRRAGSIELVGCDLLLKSPTGDRLLSLDGFLLATCNAAHPVQTALLPAATHHWTATCEPGAGW